jgi:hypothetical protein
VGTCRSAAKGEAQGGSPHKSESTKAEHRGGGVRSVCLAAYVSGGLKSRSPRGPGMISKGGGNASPAEGRDRYGDVYTGTNAKAGDSQDGPGAASEQSSEGRAPTARWGLKGLRRILGS